MLGGNVDRSTIWRWESKGCWPKRVRFGPNSMGWIRREVNAELARRAADVSQAGRQQLSPNANDAGLEGLGVVQRNPAQKCREEARHDKIKLRASALQGGAAPTGGRRGRGASVSGRT
jgi:hypothetical protein